MNSLSGITFLLAALFAGSAFAGGSRTPPPSTVPQVDLVRYQGLWYEIARFEQSFQKDCEAVTAEYTPRDDGKITVLNTCRQGAVDGPVKSAKGVARVADKSSNAKLRVSFFWPFEGDYWIFELGEAYEYAVVGSPDRDSLWFLSRTPQMDPAVFDDLSQRMTDRGFDVSRLRRTQQPLP